MAAWPPGARHLRAIETPAVPLDADIPSVGRIYFTDNAIDNGTDCYLLEDDGTQVWLVVNSAISAAALGPWPVLEYGGGGVLVMVAAHNTVRFTAAGTYQLTAIATAPLGRDVWIANSSGGVVTILPGVGETINGGASYTLDVPYSSVRLVAMSATDWQAF